MSLPEKYSQLLELARRDFELCEQDPDYSINMKVWHTFNSTLGQCEVCLAGSLLAKTYNIPRNRNFQLFSEDASDLTRPRLAFLACVAKGEFSFLLDLPFHVIKELNDMKYLPYHTDPQEFKQYIQNVIKVLKSYDL